MAHYRIRRDYCTPLGQTAKTYPAVSNFTTPHRIFFVSLNGLNFFIWSLFVAGSIKRRMEVRGVPRRRSAAKSGNTLRWTFRRTISLPGPKLRAGSGTVRVKNTPRPSSSSTGDPRSTSGSYTRIPGGRR